LRLITIEGQGKTPKTAAMGIQSSPETIDALSDREIVRHSFRSIRFKKRGRGGGPTGFVRVGQRPWGLALSRTAKDRPTPRTCRRTMSPLVDLVTKQVLKKIAAGNRPWGVAIISR